jgi:4-amino-4-deoxy-L-arabinose transferase-like glycosyltransferase
MHELETLARGGEYAASRPANDRRATSAHAHALPSAQPRALLRRALALGAVSLFAASVSAAARGIVPQWLGGAAVTASYVAAVAAVLHAAQTFGLWARDEAGAVRPLLKRHGFWLVALAGVLYLPTLGLSSLWDPWETHYGEVAREILVRHDWISLWWAHDGFFYSKPVLIFWMQAIAMVVTGVNVQPGHVLDGGAHPEWAVRMPNALLAVLGLYLLYWGAAKAFGRRAALLGGLVLATCPFWFLLAHQSTADMAFVGPMAAAMGLLLRGLYTGDDEIALVHEVKLGSRVLRLSAWHLCIGAIVLCAVPQALYLASRNVDLVLTGSGAHGFRPHLDSFEAGSGGGNCGQPGNAACATVFPAFHFEPFAQALLWLAGTAILLRLQWNERRIQRLCYLGAWLFAAIATLAKGPAGFGLPALCALAHVAATRRWRVLLNAEIVSGLLIVAVVALPWYVAAYVRHGAAFTDELIFHDMFNRAFSHVHDTNEGEETSFRYYVCQLGYGLFPWIGLAPLGLVAWMRGGARGDDGDARRRDGAILLFMWFLFAFALFTLMGTKFHHYILPAVPPVAMLIGLAIDEVLGRRERAAAPSASADAAAQQSRMIGVAAAAGALLLALVARDLVTLTPGEHDGAIHFAQLFSYQYHRPWPSMLDFGTTLTIFGCAGVGILLLIATRALRRPAIVGTFALATLFAVWCGDVYLSKTGRHWGQGDVIRAYYASRAGEAEPLVAYQMNWKGENFYTGNRVPAFKSTGAPFTQWLGEQRDHGTKVVYFVVEHSRVGGLKSEAKAKAWQAITTRDDSHQFVLMRAEL